MTTYAVVSLSTPTAAASKKPLHTHLVSKFGLRLISAHARAVEAALGCSTLEAEALISAGQHVVNKSGDDNDIIVTGVAAANKRMIGQQQQTNRTVHQAPTRISRPVQGSVAMARPVQASPVLLKPVQASPVLVKAPAGVSPLAGARQPLQKVGNTGAAGLGGTTPFPVRKTRGRPISKDLSDDNSDDDWKPRKRR